MTRLIVLVGQTASGKSDLAVEVAKLLTNTVIINIDSRQIYQKLTIGSGKVEGHWMSQPDSDYSECMMSELFERFVDIFVYQDIPHFLIDFVDPHTRFTLSNFLHAWTQLTVRLPQSVETIIAVGGTGLYAKALIEQYPISNADARREEYQQRLEKRTIFQLQQIANQLGMSALNPSDNHNPRRLVSTILRQTFGNAADKLVDYTQFEQAVVFEKVIDVELGKSKIKARVESRITQGMIEEVENLQMPLSRLCELGLEYRTIGMFLHGLIAEDDWKQLLTTQIIQYARRQRIWNRTQLSAMHITDKIGLFNLL